MTVPKEFNPTVARGVAPAGAAEARTTLSFYRYVVIDKPQAFRDALFREWSALRVLGRIYVAREGINAQLSVPSAWLERFRNAVDAHELLKDVPFKIAVEEGAISFNKLTIKVRPKLVADGLADDAFDATNVGEHLDADAFNRKMDAGAMVIDMRNNYECMIGHFEGAYLPKADTFRAAIDEVVGMLGEKKTEEQEPEILLYCTGGIRCEKASAYLRHHGFTNVGQLHGGIIDYARQVKASGMASKYKGQNFVFDGRMTERITDDVVSACMQCGVPSDRIANCAQHTCNMLLVQCEACAARYADCCSPSCREIHQLPEDIKRAWCKGKASASSKSKAISDPEALRKRIAEEEALLAQNGTLYPEMMDISPNPM
ncbi:MAG: rhodanese-related sulfurtransferase [Flavobacteriales bacterium]|nr:rhodanese-related sulfurtransferase [Flavobacteriales bacterium]